MENSEFNLPKDWLSLGPSSSSTVVENTNRTAAGPNLSSPFDKPEFQGLQKDWLSLKTSNGGSSSGHRNTARHVAAFAVQCEKCSKWRKLSSEKKYEEIRECILECPWECTQMHSSASCEDPGDIKHNERYLWAVDDPNIPASPQGWKRELIFRSRGASKLGDIYYNSPCGKKLRSRVDVGRFLNEHPHYVMEGAHLDRFSFKFPKALFEGSVGGKRIHCGESSANGPSREMRAANINTAQEYILALGNSSFDISGCKPTNKSDVLRPTVLDFPQILKKKRSPRMRRTTNWNLFLNEHPHYVMEGARLESGADGSSREMRAANINTAQEYILALGNSSLDGSVCKPTDKSDVLRPTVLDFPQILKKKRSPRMRRTTN